MASITVHTLVPDDVPAVETLLSAKRRQYAKWSPIFWRPAVGGSEVHELFLSWLLTDRANLCLTTVDLDGVLIATPRDGGWLIDDFAVAGPAAWSTVGRALIDHAFDQLGSTASVVCAGRDEEQRRLLTDVGLTAYEQWWVAEPARIAGPGPGATSRSRPVATITTAPPVYDPGGPVALVSSWDGDRDALAEFAQIVGDESVLVVVPVGNDDDCGQAALQALGFTVASVWYR